MKVENFDYSVQSEGVLSSKEMGFDEKGKVFIYEMLRKNIYSDPVLAIIREVYCNSLDSHVVANQKDKQIEVTFPTFQDPNFKIRDYGLGLSHEEIYNIYANYGASTKRNDNNQIGSLGIGAKSPFAYTDSFIITSIKNGIKNIYNAVILPSGEGVINHIYRESTHEHSGLEVDVPVQPQDIDKFINKGINYFLHLSNRPVFHNLFKPIHTKKYIIRTEKYARFEDGLPSMVIMGSIPYILDTSKLGNDLNISQKKAFEKHWEFYVDIGDVDFSANRETLRYTDKTINIINELILSAINHYQQEIENQFAQCKTLFEAKVLWKELDNNNLFYKFCPKQVYFNGIEINNNKFEFNDGCGVKIFEKCDYRRAPLEVSSINTDNKDIYWFVDRISYKRNRFKALNNGSIIFQVDSSKNDLESIIAKYHLQGFNFIDLRTISFNKPIRVKREKSSTINLYDERGSLSVYKNGWDEYSSDNSPAFETILNDNQTFYYLPIYKTDYANDNNKKYIKCFEFGKKHGLFNFDLYGVPTFLAGVKKKKNWVNFADYCDKLNQKTTLEFNKLSENRRNDYFLCEYLVNNISVSHEQLKSKEIRNLTRKRDSLLKKTNYYKYAVFRIALSLSGYSQPENFHEIKSKYSSILKECSKNIALLDALNVQVLESSYFKYYNGLDWLEKDDVVAIQKLILNYKFNKNKKNENKLELA